MRLSKSEVSPSMPYPLQDDATARRNGSYDLPAMRRASDLVATDSPTVRAVADLMDLVADHRSDLSQRFLDVLSESKTASTHARELSNLIAACGVAEASSPCATAIAIAADLERLARAGDGWTHPAQIVKRPNVSALARLCAARIEGESGEDRERLEKIQPRLARAARLTEKAASRRDQGAAGRRSSWADRWL